MAQADIRSFPGGRIHLVGIGGSSMSGLAELLHHQGYAVSGSDRDDSHTLEALRAKGIAAYPGSRPEQVRQAALLVYSAAISGEDPERLEAARLGIPQMERAVLLGQLMRGYANRACVCGTHGKTTTAAMLAQVLIDTGADPTVHIGGALHGADSGTRVGAGEVFVAEACEYNRSFLKLSPTLAVVTNIEPDHLECYGSMEALEEAYLDFLRLLPKDGLILGLGDDGRVLRLLERAGGRQQLFGRGVSRGWSFQHLRYSREGHARFTATHEGRAVCELALSVAGDFNALHALAALAAAAALGTDPEAAARSLSAFHNVKRRFEYTGTVQGMLLYHDYGHNPAEMRSAISVALLQGRRVIAVMQPHTFSRVRTLFDDYLTCTARAALTLVTDIYAAREKDPGDLNSAMLVDGMRRHGVNAVLTPTFADTEAYLLAHGRPGDLVLTMGCGNINLLNESMQARWDARQGSG